MAGEVVWYVTGRFYADSSGNLYDVGYFLNLQGIGGALSEADAYLTFAADPFSAPTIQNGSLTIGIDATGSFSIYLLDTPGASFDDPATFSAGTPIATFSRIAIVPTVKIGIGANATLLSNVFTAQLTSSQPFTFQGVTYDLANVVGSAITQWGTAASISADTMGVPFVGSAIRTG